MNDVPDDPEPERRVVDVTAEIDSVLDAVVESMGGSRRDGQHDMARAVAAALAGGEHLMVQAGTGTGKSLAYLVPTLLHTVRNDERAVISTATLALQRQVMGHDLPLVAAVVRDTLPREPQVALLKGWHNYVCKHKVAGGYPAEDESALFDLGGTAGSSSGGAEDHPVGAGREDSLGAQVVRVREWADDTDTGDRDDLVPGVSDRAWRQVSVSSMECLGQTCPMRGECFPERARQQARTADVVVTNHAMLGIAASGSPGVLPEFDCLVVDEAHELPSRVTSQASVDLTAPAVERVARMARRQAGLATQALDDAAVLLRTVLTAAGEGRWTGELPGEVEGAVRAIADGARQVVSAIKQDSVKAAGGDGGAGMVQVRSAALVLFEVADRLLSDRLKNNDDVVWCSRGLNPGDPMRINVAPLDVAGPIGTQLLAERGAVLTSATLTLGGTFDATAGAVGLVTGQYQGLEVASPFDYGKQGILYIAKHLPAPGRDGTDLRLLDEIAELIGAAGGRTLGLFSSRRGAVAAAEAMRERLDLPILVQGEDSVPELVRAFASDPQTCLFGTLTLWQGVDVPGTACQLVLIDRIPFPRPDEPVTAARSDAVAARGGNGFMEVSATHAALYLAQGAGRLIRSVSDRGVVAILDSRVATARYGTFLTRSLPPLWPTTNPAIVRAALTRLAQSEV